MGESSALSGDSTECGGLRFNFSGATMAPGRSAGEVFVCSRRIEDVKSGDIEPFEYPGPNGYRIPNDAIERSFTARLVPGRMSDRYRHRRLSCLVCGIPLYLRFIYLQGNEGAKNGNLGLPCQSERSGPDCSTLFLRNVLCILDCAIRSGPALRSRNCGAGVLCGLTLVPEGRPRVTHSTNPA